MLTKCLLRNAYLDKDKDNLLFQKKIVNNKWLNKIVKLTFEVFGQSK